MLTKDDKVSSEFSLLVQNNGQMIELPIPHLRGITVDAIHESQAKHLMPPLDHFNTGYIKVKTHDPL